MDDDGTGESYLDPRPVVTFDLFSALLDSRQGGAHAFSEIGSGRGWSVAPEVVFGRWDALNKRAQYDCEEWVPFRVLAEQTLAMTYDDLGLASEDVHRDTVRLIASMAYWPLWPDVEGTLLRWAEQPWEEGYRIGLLSNVDDDIFYESPVARLVDHEVAMTSEWLRAYKPHPGIYTAAMDYLGPTMVHVATSARDVRGALEAGCPMVRLRRPGHDLDPAGPRPKYEADKIEDLPPLLAEAIGR
jgi:2-haloacid dehalogenase